ncbi:hypothetical protein P6166_11240 [Stenotrophomonas sp. HITSZ_GD]|uniref:hypothetical protein n=1 Tax=Stenotrophomonas sp. HITSZ_GD TaxID=3037248 RepID=UPI00240E96D9|nr:hypothetical protein [Stenotrophomonas sp. HITSZ_GD]MDG2525928.1 hypothetical protein [Stenotrophomonas sp. HITSZ_GD]
MRSLTGRQKRQLSRQFAIAALGGALGGLSVDAVARLLEEIVPGYETHDDTIVSSRDGLRWFREPIEAVTDAIWRAGRLPELASLNWRLAITSPRVNEEGWWAAPGLVDVLEHRAH